MKIVKIDWLNREIQEGILTVSSNTLTFQVFSHPCTYRVGDLIETNIKSLDEDNIVRVNKTSPILREVPDIFRHEIIAKVEDVSTSLVSVGDVKIELGGHLPGGIVNGDYISFQSWRLNT